MASKDVFEKILNGIGLDSGADDDDYDDYDDEDVEIEVERERVPKRSKPKFVPTRRSSSSNRGERVDEMYNIHRMHAKTIDDGKQITELLKNRIKMWKSLMRFWIVYPQSYPRMCKTP